MELSSLFAELFAILERAGYRWEPISPDRKQAWRAQGHALGTFEKFFGLGDPATAAELEGAGLPQAMTAEVLRLHPNVSRLGETWVVSSTEVHHAIPGAGHPDSRTGGIAYLGQETADFLRYLEPHREIYRNQTVLDLGSGSGALALELALAYQAQAILGIELAAKAVEWSTASARAQALDDRATFARAAIGTAAADQLVYEFARVHCIGSGGAVDHVVFNPPMAIPSRATGRAASRPQRDGGHLGIELPLRFLEFAGQHLRVGGTVACLATNPRIGGRDTLFPRIAADRWKTIDRQCLHRQFNQSLHRQERYGELGIERIELYCLRLQKL